MNRNRTLVILAIILVAAFVFAGKIFLQNQISLNKTAETGTYSSRNKNFINGKVLAVISGKILVGTADGKQYSVGFDNKTKMGVTIDSGPVLELPSFDKDRLVRGDIVWVRLASESATAESVLIFKNK